MMQITDAPQDFEYQIDVLTEIDDIFESDYDKENLSIVALSLILCNYCKKEYLLPAYE